MNTLIKVTRIGKNLENKNKYVYLQCIKKTRVLTVPNGTTKTKKL